MTQISETKDKNNHSSLSQYPPPLAAEAHKIIFKLSQLFGGKQALCGHGYILSLPWL